MSAEEYVASLGGAESCNMNTCGCAPSRCCTPMLCCDCCKVSIISSSGCCCTGTSGPGCPSDTPCTDSSSAIVPFSSGHPITVTTGAGGLSGTYGVMGFGSSAASHTPLRPTIDTADLANFAFSAPRNGTVTAISGFFGVTSALALVCSNVTLNLTLYQSAMPSNAFVPIAATSLDLPALSGVVAPGKTIHGHLSNLKVPVTTESRLLLVISARATGSNLIHTVTGYASAGIAIG